MKEEEAAGDWNVGKDTGAAQRSLLMVKELRHLQRLIDKNKKKSDAMEEVMRPQLRQSFMKSLKALGMGVL